MLSTNVIDLVAQLIRLKDKLKNPELNKLSYALEEKLKTMTEEEKISFLKAEISSVESKILYLDDRWGY